MVFREKTVRDNEGKKSTFEGAFNGDCLIGFKLFDKLKYHRRPEIEFFFNLKNHTCVCFSFSQFGAIREEGICNEEL